MGPQNTSPKSRIPGNHKWKYACLLMVGSLVIIFLFIAVRATQSKLKIGFGQQSIEIDINNNQISLADIISNLFSTDESTIQTRALLMEKHNLYYVEDPNLIHLIETADKDAFLSKELRVLLKDLRGPFKRDWHTFYNIDDVQIVDAIEKLGVEHKVSSALRHLRAMGQGPFEIIEKSVLIGVPSENKIKKGFAAACQKNDFYNKNIRIFDSVKRMRSIYVYVNEYFPCPDYDSDSIRLIYLSEADALEIFDKVPFEKKKDAFAVLGSE